MAIVVRNTNYNGEVLEKILVLATTGNDLVEKGLIMVIPGVEKKISLPRIKTGKMLQKRVLRFGGKFGKHEVALRLPLAPNMLEGTGIESRERHEVLWIQ